MTIASLFDLTGRVAVITGGAGLLGEQHARIVAEAGGIPVLLDVDSERAQAVAERVSRDRGVSARAIAGDITKSADVRQALVHVLDEFGRVDMLVNNATNNPRVQQSGPQNFSRFEHFPLDQWASDLDVGITGAFLCSQVFGVEMARRQRGVIVNVASDLALIGPDQRLYRQPDLAEDRQPTKPVTYSVVKSALIGLTRYLATYWAKDGVRVNAICPGGVYDGQSVDFVERLASLIPMGRMAEVDEYQGAMLFLLSDASSYMTGANLVVDGGRTCW